MWRSLTRISVRSYSCVYAEAMDLAEVTSSLKKFAAPTLAGSWDNVGLLVEPSPPHKVKKMLLTNDLTCPVMDEAIQHGVDMILSYHPPIFVPLKRLTQSKWKERIIVRCLENRIAVYSPHTSYDAVKGGVNDWLIEPFDGEVKPIETVQNPSLSTPGKYRVEVSLPADNTSTCLERFSSLPGVKVMTKYWTEAGEDKCMRVSVNATASGLSLLVDAINQIEGAAETMEILELTKAVIPNQGPGRVCQLSSKISLSAAVEAVKAHLKLQHIRLAKAITAEADVVIQRVAVCAGSGSSVLARFPADLYVTGEMSHHEVLEAVHNGTSVILCDHSNTERGFLRVLKEKLSALLNNQVDIIISDLDEDPLKVV